MTILLYLFASLTVTMRQFLYFQNPKEFVGSSAKIICLSVIIL